MKPLWVLLLAVSLALGASRDSLTVSVLPTKAAGNVLRVPVGIWWPEYDSKAKVKASFPGHAAKKDVVVWFHGGMTSGNCQKGLVAGEAFSDIFLDVVVLSSACDRTAEKRSKSSCRYRKRRRFQRIGKSQDQW